LLSTALINYTFTVNKYIKFSIILLTTFVVGVEFNVTSKTIFTANHLTDTDKQNTPNKYNSKKQTTQNTAKQNYPGSVAFYNTWPGINEMGFRAHTGHNKTTENNVIK